jgi:O-antigen ligase
MTAIAFVALWVFVFSLPWEVVGAAGGVSVVARLTGGAALGIALITVAIGGRFRRLHRFHLAMLLFLLWIGVDLLLIQHIRGRPPGKFWTFIQLGLVVWMIWELARSYRRVIALLLAYVLGAYVAVGDTLRVYRTEGSALRRFTAGSTDPNDLAMTLALAVPMAWYLGLRHRHPLARWACRVYVPLSMLAIVLTGSRGGLITAFVALLIVPFTMDRLTPARLVTAVALLGVGAGLAIVYVPDTIFERLSTTGAEVAGGGLGNRGQVWLAGLHAFALRPLTGHGTGGFVRAVTPELGIHSNVAHNSYLSLMVEQGLVGLVLYLLMFLAVYRDILRLTRMERRFALILFGTLCIAILPLTWEDRKPVWFVLAALVGFSQAVASSSEATRRPNAPRPVPMPIARAGARGSRPPRSSPGSRDALG